MEILDSLEEIIAPSIVSMVEKEYNPYLVIWLQQYATKLGEISDRPQLKYTASAIPGDAINAFSVVGGNIYVYDGLIKRFPKKVVAGVIGHEIGHVARYHCINSVIAYYGIDYITGLINQENTQKLAKMVLELVWRGYGRQFEFEADKYAVDYNYKAGLYPFGIKHFMEWLVSVEQHPQDKINQLIDKILSTHPPATERLERINSEIAKLGITEKVVGWETLKEALPWLIPLTAGGIVAGLVYKKLK